MNRPMALKGVSALAVALALAGSACGQTTVPNSVPTKGGTTIAPAATTIAIPDVADGHGVVISATNPLPITGSISASFSGFTPTAGATATLAVTTTSSDVTLPTGASVIVTNYGASDAAFRIQVGAGTAVATDFILKSGAAVGLATGTATHISAITAAGSTTLNIQGGLGGAAGYGGGGGSGGGGAVTVADGADVALGAKADSAATTDTGTFTFIGLFKRLLQGITTLNGAVSTSALQTSANTKLDTLHTDLGTLNTTASSVGTVKLQDSGGGDMSDTTNHALKIDTNIGAGNFTPAQVSVATTATVIAASRATRALITVVNTTTTDIYIGGSGVTTSTGLLLPGTKGASVTLPFTGAVYGIVASGTATVTEAEVY